MIRLFDEIPVLKNDRILLRPMEPSDIPGIEALSNDPDVYRFLPTFLYEQKYGDKSIMLERLEEECFKTKESILLAVCPADAPDTFMGIAEIYNYEPEKEKASIGYRLRKEYWGKGFAGEINTLLTDYLIRKTDVRKITGHIMVENTASAKVCAEHGYIPRWRNLSEDWGRGEDVIVDKWSYKLSPEEKEEALRHQ